MWQGVCSHLSRWYPFHVVCARVHHLTCAFTHMQRIQASMLDPLSVSMSLSGARIRVGVMGNDVWALNHCSKCKSSKYASDSYSFPPCVSLFRSHILSTVAVQCAISCSRTLHAPTRIHPRECQRPNYTNICIPVPAHGPADG